MKIAILAMGSRGDVQPLVGLAIGLQQAGHHIRFASHPNFEKMVLDAGLEFFLIPINPVEVLEGEQGRATMEQGGNPLKSIRAFAKMMYPHMMQMSQSCWDACQGIEAIISPTFGIYVVPHINERLNLPTVAAYFQPQHSTGAFPSNVFSPWRKRPSFINRLSWPICDALYWLPLKGWVNDYRRERLGLKRLPRTQLLSGRTKDRTTLSLYGFSPLVVPKSAEWDDNIHITGYWFLDANKDWVPPEELTQFLAAGPPPIYVGFGSMSTRSSDKTTDTILRALSRTRQRGLLAKGWGGVSKTSLPDDMFIIESAPHDWLFPQVAAVVHHCGAGTTAAGLRAGVPTIPVPHFADQPFWAKQLFDLGVAPKAILHEELNVDNLSQAIDAAVNQADIKGNSAALGQKIRSEDGIGNAVSLIDDYLKRQ
ncbi:MAG: glycosyltransferase family 1 protein [Phycisphaerales bacterium]|nr:MAG: glycosyltransferase family 1 protein [Phycisphaerales bacterium]